MVIIYFSFELQSIDQIFKRIKRILFIIQKKCELKNELINYLINNVNEFEIKNNNIKYIDMMKHFLIIYIQSIVFRIFPFSCKML